jgi:hypothetical protein
MSSSLTVPHTHSLQGCPPHRAPSGRACAAPGGLQNPPPTARAPPRLSPPARSPAPWSSSLRRGGASVPFPAHSPGWGGLDPRSARPTLPAPEKRVRPRPWRPKCFPRTPLGAGGESSPSPGEGAGGLGSVLPFDLHAVRRSTFALKSANTPRSAPVPNRFKRATGAASPCCDRRERRNHQSAASGRTASFGPLFWAESRPLAGSRLRQHPPALFAGGVDGLHPEPSRPALPTFQRGQGPECEKAPCGVT